MNKYNAILIPGGGVREMGTLPIWTLRRLDKAIQIGGYDFIIPLSAGTTHKPPPLDNNGRPIFESISAAKYLIENGVPSNKILVDISSYDTIGNAYFSRVIHVDPLDLKRLLVITSDFHMPRTKVIFSWVYNLKEKKTEYELYFEKVSDEGIDDEILIARKNKERRSMAEIAGVVNKINTLKEFHKWLFNEHAAYSINKSGNYRLSDDVLSTY